MTAKLVRTSRDADNPATMIIEILHEDDRGEPIYFDTVLTPKPIPETIIEEDRQGRLFIGGRWRPKFLLVSGEWERVDTSTARTITSTVDMEQFIARHMDESERRVREGNLTGGFLYEANREADADMVAVRDSFPPPDTVIEPARPKRTR